MNNLWFFDPPGPENFNSYPWPPSGISRADREGLGSAWIFSDLTCSVRKQSVNIWKHFYIELILR